MIQVGDTFRYQEKDWAVVARNTATDFEEKLPNTTITASMKKRNLTLFVIERMERQTFDPITRKLSNPLSRMILFHDENGNVLSPSDCSLLVQEYTNSLPSRGF